MASGSKSTLGDADTVTLVVHGIGRHQGKDIAAAAAKGFRDSELAAAFRLETTDRSVLSRTRREEYPWTQKGLVRLRSDDSHHVVLPCVWSGERIGGNAAFWLLGIALAYAALVAALVLIKTYLGSWDERYFWVLGGAIAFDLLARKKGGGGFLFTPLIAGYGLVRLALLASYPYLPLLPAAVLCGLGLAVALPAVRCAPLARNLIWRVLIILLAVGLVLLLTGAGLLLGDLATRGAELLGEAGQTLWSTMLFLSGPLLAFAIIAAVLRLTGALSMVDLLHDVTRYLGSPQRRQELMEALAELIADVERRAPKARVQLVSHSLGTVLVTHALARIQPRRPVRLVTMGSPLLFLSKVFPKVLQTPEDLARSYQRSGSVSSWINLWRDGDRVGRALDVRAELFTEGSLGPGGHADYWQDKSTWHAIAAWVAGRPLPVSQQPATSFFSRHGATAMAIAVASVWTLLALAWKGPTISTIGAFPDLIPRGQLEVRVVRDPSEEPVPGVHVQIRDQSGVTGSGGRLRLVGLRAGAYKPVVPDQPAFDRGGSLWHYRPPLVMEEAEVVKDGLSRVTVRLHPLVLVTGRITGADCAAERCYVVIDTDLTTRAQPDGTFSVQARPTEYARSLRILVGGASHEVQIPSGALQLGEEYDLGSVDIGDLATPRAASRTPER